MPSLSRKWFLLLTLDLSSANHFCRLKINNINCCFHDDNNEKCYFRRGFKSKISKLQANKNSIFEWSSIKHSKVANQTFKYETLKEGLWQLFSSIAGAIFINIFCWQWWKTCTPRCISWGSDKIGRHSQIPIQRHIYNV